jgi:hypothetical protein
VPALGHKDVCGLDVAVDDTFGVSGVERVRNLDRQTEQHTRLDGLSADPMLQGHTVQKLHDQERMTVLLPDLMDRADIGMVQSRGRLRLPLEAGQGLGVFGDVLRQKLQGDKPVQGQVLGLVDHTHTAATELLDDAVVRDDYDAEVCALDFGADRAVATINAWVAEKTHGKIGSILSSLDPLTFLVAINAVYFKDSWSKPFMPGFTREELFQTTESQKLKVPLMSQFGSYSYYEDSRFQAVCLRYKTPRLAMYVFLPTKKSSLREFRLDLNSGAWDKWMRRFEVMPGHIRIPRFKLTYQAMLNGPLSQLGMAPAFDPQRARFDAISSPPPAIWIETVLHRAFVEVNEEGTEAAATTVAMMPLSSEYSRPRIRTFEMTVDRPFFFAICDSLTNTILFMGSVEEPDSEMI